MPGPVDAIAYVATRGGAPLEVTCVSSFRSYQAHRTATVEDRARRAAYEDALATVAADRFRVRAHCHACGSPSAMQVTYEHAYQVRGRLMPNWREWLKCERCGLNNRHRAAVQIVEHDLDDPRASVYVTEQASPLFERFAARYEGIVGSRYAARAGARADGAGVRHEDITALSFADETFDAVLSFDVLEHVPDFARALAEVCRVLKPGGRFFFSVPFNPDLEHTVVRARVGADGTIVHLLPPELHDDPMSPDGILCFQQFGWDLLDVARTAGFTRAEARLYWSAELGYLGDQQVLLVAGKA